MSLPLNTELCQELANDLETLTHSGQKILDSDIMKRVKKICKSDEGYVEHAYHLLLHQLGEQHAEVRYSAFQIIDELFRRSHHFRELLVCNLQTVIELTAETNPSQLLPPPKTAAKNLKCLALRSFNEWNSQFGAGYKRLQIGHNFLKKCKNIDFSNVEFESAIQQARNQESINKQQIINEGKIQKTLTEYNDLNHEIRNTVTSLETCLELLVPSLDEFFITSENAEDIFYQTPESEFTDQRSLQKNSDLHYEREVVDIREHGMNTKFSVEVEIKPVTGVKETAENAPIIENARDSQRLIQNRYLPSAKRWLKMLTKCSGKAEDIKKIVDLKEAMENCLKKYNQLNFNEKENEDSSDSDFEEVPEKEGYEENVLCNAPNTLLTENANKNHIREWCIFSRENNEKDPTTLLSTINSLQSVKHPITSHIDETSQIATCTTHKQEVTKQKIMESQCSPSTSGIGQQELHCENIKETKFAHTSTNHSEQSRKEKLLSVAPKLPFDVDLYHWEEEKLTAPTILVVKPDNARFWSATTTDEMEEIAVPEGTASLRTRVIEFSGQYEPVKWACRTPLPSGKLCPRRDRYKCPFHGPIVARDNSGKCINPEDEAKLQQLKEEQQQETPDWQDPKLLAEIKEATGIDLKMPEKGKGKKKTKKTKHPGLTDIKAKQNNTYTRLAKKVFKRETVKRVAQRLDNADHKRFRDKFGDQFNYVHETS